MRFDRYVFVCLNERPEGHPRGSCFTSGANAVFDELKRLVKEKGLNLEVRVNKAGCMECCEIGPTIMVSPDNVWYSQVKVEDVLEIVESHLIAGKPVERIKADFSRYNRKQLGL